MFESRASCSRLMLHSYLPTGFRAAGSVDLQGGMTKWNVVGFAKKHKADIVLLVGVRGRCGVLGCGELDFIKQLNTAGRLRQLSRQYRQKFVVLSLIF